MAPLDSPVPPPLYLTFCSILLASSVMQRITLGSIYPVVSKFIAYNQFCNVL